MRPSTSWVWIIFTAVVVGELMVVGFAALFAVGSSSPQPRVGAEVTDGLRYLARDFTSNKEEKA